MNKNKLLMSNSRFLDWLSLNRYTILVLFLFLRFATFVSNGFWYGDFWEHSAVVKELMEHPFTPTHPLLLTAAPHAFMSPYSLLVACVAKTSGITPVEALSVFSLINFLLFAYGLKRFSKVICNYRPDITAFYLMLMTLYLWGDNPWVYSSFFHIDIIGFVLPYPSMFSIGLSLIGFSIFKELLESFSYLKATILWLIIFSVLLSHPLTFIFLVSGLFFLCLSESKSLSKNIFRLCIFIISVLVAVYWWPYYSIYNLLLGSANIYHLSNSIMYNDVIKKIWPNIFVLPFIFISLNNKNVKILLIWTISLFILYIFGLLSGNYSYGRIISFCILLIHLSAALGMNSLEKNTNENFPSIVNVYRFLLVIFLLLFSFSWLPASITRFLTISHQVSNNQKIINETTYKNITFIKKHLKSDSLILADIDTSWIVPTFAGKVIAALHSQAFVDDMFEREYDLNVFFNVETKLQKRLDFLFKYKPTFLLLDLTNPQSSAIEDNLSRYLELIDENIQYRLFKIQYH